MFYMQPRFVEISSVHHKRRKVGAGEPTAPGAGAVPELCRSSVEK